MGFSLGSTLSKAVETVGDYIPGIGDARAQEKANDTNISLSKENREWMERMSNSAYQRAMVDMGKAGLNPMLAYTQGGASVPTSAAASVAPASHTALANTAIGAFTGIKSAYTQAQQANTAQAQGEATIALQATQAAETATNTAKIEAETEKVKETIKSEKVRRKLDEQQAKIQGVKTSAADLANEAIGYSGKFRKEVMTNSAKETKKWSEAVKDVQGKWQTIHKEPKSLFQNFKDSFIKKGN